MTYQPLTNHNIMELWLFDTCNFRCGYCGLVPTAQVRQTEQLAPYRDPEYIRRIVRFFTDQRPAGRPWAVLLTGGEPTLMPNLDLFVLELGRQGDTVAIYSNFTVSLDKVFSTEALGYLSYTEASFHPDWHLGQFNSDQFFANVARAKELGVPVVVRFVGAPPVLHLLPTLEARCAEIGVAFLPTTLFNPDYPRAYTAEQRALLASYMVGRSSLIQLDGGLLMQGRKCRAADRLFSARLHQGGDVTPCISVDSPVLGNVFANTLEWRPGAKGCYKPDQLCSCDVHFQQGIVEGVDDTRDFARILAGENPRRSGDYEQWKANHDIKTSHATWVGQGITFVDENELVRKAPNPKRVA